jgi:hypothetical protein
VIDSTRTGADGRKLYTCGNEILWNVYVSLLGTLLSETRCVLPQKKHMKIVKV